MLPELLLLVVWFLVFFSCHVFSPPVPSFALLAEFQSLSLSLSPFTPCRILNLIAQKSEITPSRCSWGQILRFYSCTPMTKTVICAFFIMTP